ncbi:hypothetical protein PLICRDRAFT_89960 [Plicaturopsis crispa FD-325 SS-3]|nr:hypothetical protein PLICRDRAFT_89960 [Plicaturopsis crispa FD-325 SS-3]
MTITATRVMSLDDAAHGTDKPSAQLERHAFTHPDGSVSACILYPGVHARILGQRGFPKALPVDLSADERPYTVRAAHSDGEGAQSKGLGMFATRPIALGELIIQERVLVVLPSTLPDFGPAEKEMEAAFALLSEQGRHAYMGLFNHDEEDPSPLWTIFNSNALGIANLPGAHKIVYGGLCDEISRANHSCSPNAHAIFDPLSLSFSLRASRDIPAGAEIAHNYRPVLLLPREKRRAHLRASFNFTCLCPACTDPLSDARRALIVPPVDLPPAHAWLYDLSLPDDHVFKFCEEQLAIMEKEGAPHPELVAEHLARCFDACVALGDSAGAKRYAERAEVFEIATTGKGGRWKARGRRPEREKGWGIREAMRAYEMAEEK